MFLFFSGIIFVCMGTEFNIVYMFWVNASEFQCRRDIYGRMDKMVVCPWGRLTFSSTIKQCFCTKCLPICWFCCIAANIMVDTLLREAE